jgi:hypothetical protein|tara:strand:+ start:168 stop:365 length:198 start_codon:yes stop_codon:yes gene_type:complete
MLTAIPLIRTDDDSNLTPIERTAIGCEQMITALMMAATMADPQVTAAEREVYTTLSVAAIIPAEA